MDTVHLDGEATKVYGEHNENVRGTSSLQGKSGHGEC